MWHAFGLAFAMFWAILWPLILGFTLSGAIQAVVSKQQMARVLGDDRPATLLKACGLGAASSSCSYAAVAIARSIFRKGADFTAAMAFEIASTNLVLELTIIIVVFLGWQFAAAEFVGAPLMIASLAVLFRRFLSRGSLEAARTQAERGVAGRMEGHAGMHMELTEGTLWQRAFSDKGRTAISHYFVMDWVAVWKDVVGGLLIAGALAAWVPMDWWPRVFLTSHPTWAMVWGPVVGPLIAVLSFVCSVGNIPLAAVLWNGGISFGGVIAFIFADLIVLPILDIYQEILRRADDVAHLRDVLRLDGGGGARRRGGLSSPGTRAGPRRRAPRRGVDQLQLHDGPERLLPHRCVSDDQEIHAHRRSGDASRNECSSAASRVDGP